MNIFKKSRKTRDDEDALTATAGQEVNGFSKASRALTRKKKKEVEEKPVFDLSSALPDKDEFRTSLLMPNLSARFSMLREQDDPTTKIGKASDDSVLFPKQSLRHNHLNGNFLSDIAEVESIYSTFKPPFADDDRKGSTSDGYASDDGSIMNRARPVETNNLFGGRQKLYKVTTTSSTGLAGGKHVYGSDVSLPAFPQFRAKAKEQIESDENTDRSSVPTSDVGENDSIRSPMTGFNKNRETQSSTNSAPSHRPASTAATSVMSESPVPQPHGLSIVNKARDQDLSGFGDSVGLATSPSLSRSEVHATHRTETPPARNPVTARDSNGQKPRDNVATPEPRARKMSTTSSNPTEAQQKDVWKPLASPSRFPAPSPNPQTYLDQDDPLANNVRPNDRGKATAMGLFNKPARHYDEAQFSQRQMQLHQGRISPPSARSRSASCASANSTKQNVNSAKHQVNGQSNQVPQLPELLAAPASDELPLTDLSTKPTGTRPRSKSAASNKEASVKAKLESLIRKQNEELLAIESARSDQFKQTESDVRSSSSRRDTGQETFLLNDDDSEDETRQSQLSSKRSSRPSARSTRIPNPPAPLEIHPAFRQDFEGFNFGTEPEHSSDLRSSDVSTSSKVGPAANLSIQSKHLSANSSSHLDSPTVPTAGLGLSGLIRTHLRHASNNSSMLAPPSPALFVDEFRTSVASSTKTGADSVRFDPIDQEKRSLTVQSSPLLAEAPPTPTTAMSQHAQHMLGIATAIREANLNADKTPKLGLSSSDSHTGDQDDNDMDAPSHQRNESTETEREQQQFEEELAARRQRIDANLQIIQERSRSRSPQGERNGLNVFSLPRLPIRSNTTDRADTQTGAKAMRMLGVTSPHREPDSYMSNQPMRSGPQTLVAGEYEAANGRRTPISRPPPRHEHAHGNGRPVPPRSTTPSSRPGLRNRSTSNADRSVSRNEHLVEFDPRTMPGAFPGSPIPRRSPPRAQGYRPESPAQTRSYDRSTSRNAGQYLTHDGFQNSNGPSPPHVNRSLTPGLSPRPSPNPPYENSSQSHMARPMSPPSSALPSPNPMVVGHSNGRTTPTAVPGRITPSGTRKKSVNKGMISDPKFVSSTSSIPLVHLPRDGGPPVEPVIPPPVPAMNPRRRGNTVDDHPSPGFGPHPTVRPYAITPTISEHLIEPDVNQSATQPLRQRNRLRKSSSEGGNMAARARQQALMEEIAREKARSPNVSVFPNRSATSLAISHNGNMF